MHLITDVAAHHAQFKNLVMTNRPTEYTAEHLERLPLMYPKFQGIIERLYGISESMTSFKDDNYVEGYLRAYDIVRDCYLQIFEQIVEDRVLQMGYFGDDIGLVLARDYGWDTFKFLNRSVPHNIKLKYPQRSEEVCIIPRYCVENKHMWEKGGKVFLDADEAKMVENWSLDSVLDFYDTKKMYQEGRKLDPTSTPDMMIFLKVEDFNSAEGILRDWTMPLNWGD